jgi:ABC-type branched-subunit amino acid transport system ATPase component
VILEKGHVVWSGSSGELKADAEIARRYLHV